MCTHLDASFGTDSNNIVALKDTHHANSSRRRSGMTLKGLAVCECSTTSLEAFDDSLLNKDRRQSLVAAVQPFPNSLNVWNDSWPSA
jgi:hypothetical protein